MIKFEENLTNNSNISDEFKELARKSFGELIKMLGRERFLNWLKIQTITKDVKSLIFEWADSEEMARDAKAGEYSGLWNTIRISNGLSFGKNILKTMKHEGMHFFTRDGYLGRNCTYLNEGCTEYLTYLSGNADDNYGYEEQVEVVQFLRSLLGDSIIQTYLTGKGVYFLNDLVNVLKEDTEIGQFSEPVIDKFLDDLDDRHHELRCHDKAIASLFTGIEKDEEDSWFESEEDIDKNSQEINDFLKKIILCKFKQMAKNRVFNRNGKFDEDYAKAVVREKLKNVRFVGQEYDYSYSHDREGTSQEITEMMMEEILYEIEENCNPKTKVNTYLFLQNQHINWVLLQRMMSILEYLRKNTLCR